MNDWFYAVVATSQWFEIEEVWFTTEEKANAYADKMQANGCEVRMYMTKGD